MEKLSKREYFIAKAMQGLLSNPECVKFHESQFVIQKEILAKTAIKYSDEVLQTLLDEPILK